MVKMRKKNAQKVRWMVLRYTIRLLHVRGDCIYRNATKVEIEVGSPQLQVINAQNAAHLYNHRNNNWLQLAKDWVAGTKGAAFCRPLLCRTQYCLLTGSLSYHLLSDLFLKKNRNALGVAETAGF